MKTFIAGMALLFLFCLESPAFARVCMAPLPTFGEVLEKSPVVVVARVLTVGKPLPTPFGSKAPASIDIDALWTAKGAGAQRARVWDSNAGSSCGGTFKSTSIGNHLVMALVPAVEGSIGSAAMVGYQWVEAFQQRLHSARRHLRADCPGVEHRGGNCRVDGEDDQVTE